MPGRGRHRRLSTLAQCLWMGSASGVLTPDFNPHALPQAAGNRALPARCEITISSWLAPCLAARGTDPTLTFGIPRAGGEAHELT
jgi:hypothetical protein